MKKFDLQEAFHQFLASKSLQLAGKGQQALVQTVLQAAATDMHLRSFLCSRASGKSFVFAIFDAFCDSLSPEVIRAVQDEWNDITQDDTEWASPETIVYFKRLREQGQQKYLKGTKPMSNPITTDLMQASAKQSLQTIQAIQQQLESLKATVKHLHTPHTTPPINHLQPAPLHQQAEILICWLENNMPNLDYTTKILLEDSSPQADLMPLHLRMARIIRHLLDQATGDQTSSNTPTTV